MPTFRVFETNAIPTSQDLLNEFLVNVVSTTPDLTDVSIGSKLWAIGYTIARQQSAIYYMLHFFRKQSFVLTATGKYLDLHGIEVGTLRQKANKATGDATFSRNSQAPYDILVPQGTIITTEIISSDTPTTNFVTTQDVIISAGTNIATVSIEAVDPGIVGNLPSGSITRIESTLSGVHSVATTSTSGGAAIEQDDKYRERILNAWAGRESGTAAAIRNAVMGVQGIRNVLMVDPARTKVKQAYAIKSDSANSVDQVLLETKSATIAKDFIYLELVNTNGLTLKIEQINEKGITVAQETINNITDGWNLIDRINAWTQSNILQITSLQIDSNPYDDAVKQATDNNVVSVRTTSPELQNEPVTLIIQDSPTGSDKRLIVSSYNQFRINEILGQTEETPLIEIFDGISTYRDMVTKINQESKIIQMELLEIKTAKETLTPVIGVPENTVNLGFCPVIEILSPNDTSIRVTDAVSGKVAVGKLANDIVIEYKYRATLNVDDNKIEFGNKIVEDVIIRLIPDGSEILLAKAVYTPGKQSDKDLAYISDKPKIFARQQMNPEFKMLRGQVDVTPIPISITTTPVPALLESVATAIEKVRAAGIEVKLIWPSVQLLDIDISIEIITGGAFVSSQFQDTIKTAVTNYINSLGMGETAYRDKIIAAANPNISGLKVAHIKTPLADIETPATSFLRVGTISFN